MLVKGERTQARELILSAPHPHPVQLLAILVAEPGKPIQPVMALSDKLKAHRTELFEVGGVSFALFFNEIS